MAACSVVQYWILRRRLAEAVPLQGEIYLADRIASPFVMGILRPRIYLLSSTPTGGEIDIDEDDIPISALI